MRRPLSTLAVSRSSRDENMPTEVQLDEFAYRLRGARIELGITQTEAARRVWITTSTSFTRKQWCQMESGKYRILVPYCRSYLGLLEPRSPGKREDREETFRKRRTKITAIAHAVGLTFSDLVPSPWTAHPTPPRRP